jgi:two-component system, response regulator YesN
VRFLKKFMFQFHNNYYTKLVTIFFSIITASLLFLMFIFSWQQKEFNEKAKLEFDTNSFSRFTQILEKKVLSDVNDVMFKGIFDIMPLDALTDDSVKNPFIYGNNPFDTTLSYKARLYQLQEFYPYITSIDLYNYKFDTYISSSGSVFYNALKNRVDLEPLVPYHILDNLKILDSDQMWISPEQNHVFTPHAGVVSFVQRLPLFSSSSSNDIAIIINIDPEVIYNDYFKNQLLYNSHFYMIDQNRNVLFKTSPEEYLFTAFDKDKLSEEITHLPAGTNKFVYNKSEYNIIWQSSSVSSLKYLYLSKKPSTFVQLVSSLSSVIIWFIIVFISCLAITLVVTKAVYRPIDALLKYTSSVFRSSSSENKSDIEEIANAFTSITNQLTHYKETINKNSSLLLNNIAISLLDGNVQDMEELNSWLSILNMKFDRKAFFFFTVKIDPEVYDSLENQKRDFFLLYIQEQVDNYYGYKDTNTLKFISCYHQDGVISFLVNIDEEQYSREKEVPSIILSNMKDEMANWISIAVSDPITDLWEFNNNYKTVLTYFKYVFIYGNKSVFDREKVEKFDNNVGIYDTAFKKHLKTLLKLSKFDELKAEIAEFYKQAKLKNYSYLYLQTLSAEIISMIVNEFQNNDIELPQSQSGGLMSAFLKLKSVESCAEWYANIIDVYAEGMQNRSANLDSKYMQAILEYIDKDIKNVTLNSVADEFKLSTAHFSRMFKKQTGTNFSDYVTDKRLEHVCNLLVTTDMKISDIVSTMGYLNVNYFNKIFKLKYNVTPSQYRKQHKI